jgi:LCP family protein required for cell wall assembly
MSDEPTPPSAPARRTIAQRAMLVVNIVVVLACFIGAGVLLFAKNIRDSSPTVAIDRPQDVATTLAPGTSTDGTDGTGTTPTDSGPTESFPPVDPQARNFLITGSDRNACVDPGSPWANAADPNRPGGDRPDTIMVMRVDPANSRAAILSFPRDLYVNMPDRGKGRINSAFKPNDPDYLINTLYLNFGVPIDDYVQIDFCAFKRIVEAVGGVKVPFDTPIKDPNTSLLIERAGCHTFYGDEALAYVRSRKMSYQTASGEWKREGLSDQARISRQQDFLRRLVQAALDKGVLNPSVARGLIDTVLNDVVVGQGLTINRALEFVGILRDLPPEQIAAYQIEGKGQNIGGASVLIPQTETDNMKAVLAVFRGEASLGAAPSIVTTVPPAATDATSTTAASNGPTTTARPGTPTTSTLPVVAPEENQMGQIVPSRDIKCD